MNIPDKAAVLALCNAEPLTEHAISSREYHPDIPIVVPTAVLRFRVRVRHHEFLSIILVRECSVEQCSLGFDAKRQCYVPTYSQAINRRAICAKPVATEATTRSIESLRESLSWCLKQMEGDSSASSSYWDQFPEYVAACRILRTTGGAS